MLLKKLNTAQFVGIGLLISLLAFAFLQPFYYPVDENLQDLTKVLQSGSSAHWFGTDRTDDGIFKIKYLTFNVYKKWLFQ